MGIQDSINRGIQSVGALGAAFGIKKALGNKGSTGEVNSNYSEIKTKIAETRLAQQKVILQKQRLSLKEQRERYKQRKNNSENDVYSQLKKQGLNLDNPNIKSQVDKFLKEGK